MISTLAKSMVWARAAGAIAKVANNSHARRIVLLPSSFCAGPEYRRIPALVGWAKAHALTSCTTIPIVRRAHAVRHSRVGTAYDRFSAWKGRAFAFAHPTARSEERRVG